MTDAHEIATLVRHQNWKNGGCFTVDDNDAADLIEKYARVVASEAVTKAVAEAYDQVLDMLKPSSTKSPT